jgi:hypothetical protein
MRPPRVPLAALALVLGAPPAARSGRVLASDPAPLPAGVLPVKAAGVLPIGVPLAGAGG